MKKMSNVAVFNQVRNFCSPNFKNRVNKATQENFSQLTQNILTNATYSSEMNEFLKTMVNKIVYTIYRMNTFQNKYSKYVYYNLPLGDVIEEVAVRPSESEDFDNGLTPNAEGEYIGVDMNRVSIPQVETVYYKHNCSKKHRVTISETEVVKAFNNQQGLSTLVSQIVASLSNGAELDEYLTFKELLNAYITQDIAGTPKLPTQIITLDEIKDDVSAKKFIMQMKTSLSDIIKPNCKYNPLQLVQMQDVSNMTAFIRDDVLNFIDIAVLSSAFNKSDLNLTPNGNIGGGGLTVDGIDNFGGMLPLYLDGDTYKLLYTIYNKYGKLKGYSKTQAGTTLEKKEDVIFIPNYRFETQPTYTVGQKVTRDLVAFVMDNRLPVIAIEREHFGVYNNVEAIYYNNFLVRIRKYGFSPMINAFIIYEKRTTI